MSRSHFYHIDAMVSNTIASAPLEPVVQPATQPIVQRPTPVASVFSSSVKVFDPSVVGVLEAASVSARPTTLTATSISPTISTIATRPTVTVPISDVVPVTVTIPTTPTYGGGGGGGAINTAKPATKEMTIQATKPSFLKRNLMPILLIGTAVFIFIKKPIK